MKKDMGGAAHALAPGLAGDGCGPQGAAALLVPAVENAIAGNAFRPGDVLRSRKGLTVEIGNTDAEGRLILADALTRASEEKPDLVLDFATLTGAARVARRARPAGADGAARRDRRSAARRGQGARRRSAGGCPCPRLMPSGSSPTSPTPTTRTATASPGRAWRGCSSTSSSATGIDWAHFDTFAWRPAGKPGRPQGGDALGPARGVAHAAGTLLPPADLASEAPSRLIARHPRPPRDSLRIAQDRR